jgi:outer membrane protein TolC
MIPARLRSLPGLLSPRWLVHGLCAACLSPFALGCCHPGQADVLSPELPSPCQGAYPSRSPTEVVRAGGEVTPSISSPAPTPGAPHPDNKTLPLGLDTVLALAGEQNQQVILARERLRQASAEKEIAALAWLPALEVGAAYGRHEGGIQNEDGTLTHSSFGNQFTGLELIGKFDLREAAVQRVSAERNFLQKQGEVHKITNETLLEAANAYLDLLLARSSEATARMLEKQHERLLERARKLFDKGQPSARVLVRQLEAGLAGHQHVVTKLRGQGDAASTKLAYLLGLYPCTTLVPLDPRMQPFDLVDCSAPLDELTARALAVGPGMAELERLLAVMQASVEHARGPEHFLPVLEVRMLEGAFGAGPGSTLDWDNRWDLIVGARWNLTGLLTARDRIAVVESQLVQTQISYQDLRSKLSAGVQEARNAILSGQEQIRLAGEQVRLAGEAYDLSDQRLNDRVPDSSLTEVQQALRALELAQITYLTSVSAYDKAQVRLLVLLGAAGPRK